MASKYAHIIGDLPPLPMEDPSYQEKIDVIKAEIKSKEPPTPGFLAQEYAVIRSVKEDLADELAIVQQRLTAIEQLLTESFDNDDEGWGLYGASPNTVRMPNGASVSVQLEPTGKVEDKEVFRLWCIANGYENSLQLWPATMNAITKERLLEGQPAPEGVKAYVRPKIVWRKGNN